MQPMLPGELETPREVEVDVLPLLQLLIFFSALVPVARLTHIGICVYLEPNYDGA